MAFKLYCRCTDGHYYSGTHCPYDGWSSPELVALLQVERDLRRAGIALSIDALLERSASPAATKRIIIVEFGSDDAVFDAIAPQGYVIAGKHVPITEVGPEYT